jgi:hypothetical protein
VELNKCIHLKNNKNIYLSVFYDFFKIQWVLENQGMIFLMAPLKDVFVFGRGKTISQVVFHCILKYIKLTKIVTI